MRYQPLGESGLMVSVVGVGGNNFGNRLDLEGTRKVVDAAIEAGVTLFDTAESYGSGASEELLGECFKGRRENVVIATKFGAPTNDLGRGPAAGRPGGRAYIRRAVEASLQRLQTDYIDLYQQHFVDPVTPLEETLAALHELVQEGKVRYVGSSNYSGWLVARAAHLAAENGFTQYVSAQNHYSLLERDAEREVIPACEVYGVGMLPYFPLANGLLTGKVRRDQPPAEGTRLATREGYVTDAKLDRVEALVEWAERNGRSLLEIAVAGLAAQPAVGSVIAGATKPEQVLANVAAAEWEPTAQELAEIDEIAPAKHPR